MSLPNPQAAFNRVVSRFNGNNLYDLWSISCLFSCIEYFDSWKTGFNLLHPMLYTEKVAIFDRAILDSKALDYKEKVFQGHEISHIFNAINETTAARSTLLDSSDDASARLHQFLSATAHQQIRLHESLFVDRLGRTFGLLHEIPNQYRDELRRKQGNKFVDLVEVIKQHTQLSVTEFLAVGFAAITLMGLRYEAHIPISDDLRKYLSRQDVIGTQRRAEALTKLIEESREIRDKFSFAPVDLVLTELSSLTIENIQSFLKLLARTTKELRHLMQQPIYKEGFIPDKLSPLERYPIVALGGERYIIPNLRYFDTAVTNLLHYILQEYYPGNEYNQLSGYIQEIYLRLYVKDRLPHLQQIPEISYRKSKNRVEGPDLTLVDQDNGKLIAVESKAKRTRVVSRLHLNKNYLLEDLQGAIGALEKLPAKIQDMYHNLPEYGEYQSLIDQTQQSDSISVVVIGEGVYLLHSHLNDHLRINSAHPLNLQTNPYCLMRLEDFERAVEVAAHNNLDLYNVLYNYWLRSRSVDMSEASAERFLSYPISEKTFVRKMADKFKHEYFLKEGNVCT